MPILSNPKHEAFAQLIAKGLSGKDAAVKAGYDEPRARITASELKQNAKVKARISELQERVNEIVVAEMAFDKAGIMRELEGVYRKALEARQFAAANRALEMMGMEQGMFVKSTKDVSDRPLDGLSAQDLQAVIRMAHDYEQHQRALADGSGVMRIAQVHQPGDGATVLDVQPETLSG